MSMQSFQEILATQRAAGTLFNTYTTSKSVINTTELITLPPNWWYVGRSIRITAVGAISNLATTPGTLTMEVKLGPTANIVAFTTGAMQMSTGTHTLAPFRAEIWLTCRAIGATTTANLMGQGHITSQAIVQGASGDSVITHGTLMGPATAPAVGTGFDSTTASILDFWTGFSTSSASNGIQLQQYFVEALN